MKHALIILAVMFFANAANAQSPKDWAQFNRYSQQNNGIKGNVEVVFMGDSITDIWPDHDPAFFKNNGFVGRGISGQTTSEMLVRFRQDVIGLHPKLVVILAGINDIANNNGPIELKNVFGNVVSMCELAKANGIKVAICSVLPCNEFRWRKEINPTESVKELNVMLKEYALTNKLVYIDYHSALKNDTDGLSKELSPDGCHPNNYCFSLMEEIVAKGINKALKTSTKRYVSLQTLPSK